MPVNKSTSVQVTCAYWRHFLHFAGNTYVFSNPFLLLGLPDQGYEDSDSSVFSTPSPTSKNRGISPSLLSMETQHASLKRKKIPEKHPSESGSRTPMLEKSQSLQAEIALQRPLSMVIASQSEANVIVNPATGSLQRQVSVSITPTNNTSALHQMWHHFCKNLRGGGVW